MTMRVLEEETTSFNINYFISLFLYAMTLVSVLVAVGGIYRFFQKKRSVDTSDDPSKVSEKHPHDD